MLLDDVTTIDQLANFYESTAAPFTAFESSFWYRVSSDALVALHSSVRADLFRCNGEFKKIYSVAQKNQIDYTNRYQKMVIQFLELKITFYYF